MIKVTKQSKTGMNTRFKDTNTGKEMTRGEFVKAIEQGKYKKFNIMKKKIDDRTINIPRSNPDNKKKNNLD